MIYFHVLLSMAQEPTKLRCVLYDLTEKQLHDQFLQPYKSGRNLLCGNHIYPTTEIRSVSVVSTEGTAAQALSAVNQVCEKSFKEMNDHATGLVFIRPSLIFGLNNLDKVGKDVTAHFVKEPFGQVLSDGPFRSLLKNQWVVGIGTAVVATGVSAWLKLN
jgi:hypothetical protein